MIFPVVTSIFLIYLLAFALLSDGISRVIHGIGHKEQSSIGRGFTIAVDVLEIALEIFILALPVVGFEFVAFVIAISPLITGIQILVSGLTGRRSFIKPSDINR